MKIAFDYQDPIQLSEQLAQLGQNTRITQLSGDKGSYQMAHVSALDLSIAEISSSKTLLYEGWGTSWSIDFNWITPHRTSSSPFGYCEGYEMKAKSLAGFNTLNSVPGGSWGKYSNLCASTACMLNASKLITQLNQCNAYDALERLHGDRGLDCSSQAFRQLKQLTRKDLARGIQSVDKYYDLITVCLEEGCSRPYKKTKAKNLRLLNHIVNLAHDTQLMSSPLSLSEVCQYLRSGQASLYRVCQEYFGMGIIELMTQIRLEESRRSLIKLKLTENCDINTIRDVAIFYGFQHQGRYARRYFNSFGELPSQTLENLPLYGMYSKAEKRNKKKAV